MRALRWGGTAGFVLSASWQGGTAGAAGLLDEQICMAQRPSAKGFASFCSPIFFLWVFTARGLDGAASMGFRTTSVWPPAGRIWCSLFHRHLPVILATNLPVLEIFRISTGCPPSSVGPPAQHDGAVVEGAIQPSSRLPLTLVTGPSRKWQSRWAEHLATKPAVPARFCTWPQDPSIPGILALAAALALHRQHRPASWPTWEVEGPGLKAL